MERQRKRLGALVVAGVGVVGLGIALIFVIPRLLQPGKSGAHEVVVAYLSAFKGDVTTRSPGAFEWAPAEKDQDLYDGHRVRTFRAATASVHFIELNHTLEIAEDTQVVIRSAPPDDRLVAELSAPVLDLQLAQSGRMRLRSANGKPVVFRLKDQQGREVALLDARKAAATGIDVGILFREDAPSTIAAYRTHGNEPVRIQIAGRNVELRPGTAAVIPVKRGGAVSIVELLAAPSLRVPANESRIRLKEGGAVRIAWDAVPNAHAYEIVIDRTLDTPVKQVAITDLDYAFVPDEPGKYHVRVAGVGPGDLPGDLSQPRAFTVVAPEPTVATETPLAMGTTPQTIPPTRNPTPKPTSEATPKPTRAALPSIPQLDRTDPKQRAMADGHKSLEAGNFAKAVRSYRRAATQNKDFPEPHFWLAVAFAYQGQFDEACGEFSTYVHMAPKGAYAGYANANLEACP